MRIGHGYDVHMFARDRKLILGGVDIPFEKGLAAHSDGDVLIHALCDAILGAAALGDIGCYFPDTDDKYENIDSRVLLGNVKELLKQKGLSVVNADMTLIAQVPKMAPHISSMRKNIADDLGIEHERVNIKATTTEGLGYIGREEGIAAHAVVLIE